ncbi:MAG TPA: hypothetical protein VHT75_06370 [Acidimicrobiales bacterium]|jgi:hypothetical protein|nr:hypothetical protein [Acidimicrobiales bacterium]
MAEYNEADEGRVRTYLAEHGGSVEDAAGRGLTDQMARSIGVDRPAALSALLAQMEADGLITRDMRGLRTYKIALVEGATAAPPPAPVPPAPVGPAPVGPAEAPAAESSAAVPPAEAPAGAAPAAAPPAEMPAEPAGPAVISLRDAVAGRATSPTSTRPWRRYGQAGAPTTVTPPSDVPPPPAGVEAEDATPTVGLREPHNGTAPPSPPEATPAAGWPHPPPPAGGWTPPPSGGATDRFASFRGAPPPPSSPAAPPVSTPPPPPARERKSVRSRSRGRLELPVPRTGPSSPLITAVSLAVAGLVIITVITVIAVSGSNHHVAPPAAVSSSADACRVVTPDDASAAFGDTAGVPHYVLGACVYDDGHQELIVDVARTGARQSFDGSRSATAKDVPGLGDAAYYDGGTLRVLKGTNLVLLTIQPFSPDAPSQKLLQLAMTATSRL